jgi:hypothetical protein
LASHISWGADCRNNIVPIRSGAPLPAGRGSVIYEALPTPTTPTTDYDIYVFDLQSKRQLDLTARWPFLIASKNPHASPTATEIVFTAQTYASLPAPGCNYSGVTEGRTDIFLARMGAVPKLLNLTCALSNDRYQDAIYTPNGKGLYVKVGGNVAPTQIVQYALVDDGSLRPSLKVIRTLRTIPYQEVSAPYPSAYSQMLFYFTGTLRNEAAQALNLQTMQSTSMIPASACYSSFPVAGLSGQSVFVTAGLIDKNGNCPGYDQIFLGRPGGSFTELPFNGCTISNSDPSPVDVGHTLFSSTLTGDYRAYLGDNNVGTVWALTPIGLGAGTTDLRAMSYTTERLWVPATD